MVVKRASQNSNESDGNGVYCTLDELIALKAKAEKLRYPLKHRSRSQLHGGKRSSLRGRGLDFDEVRAYQAGDEIRAIDWRVTARTGEAHTKVYKEEKEKPVFVLLDLRRSMFFGSKRYFKSVTACHLASLLAWASIKHGDRFGALIFSENRHEELKPKAGNKSALHFIQLASEFSQALLDQQTTQSNTTPENINSALKKLHQVIRPGSLVYLISDFHDLGQDSQQVLNLIARHNDIIAIHIQDQLEKQLPQARRLLFTNAEANENAIAEIHGQQESTRKQYQGLFEQKHQTLENILLDCAVTSLDINTHENVFEQLQIKSRNKRK